MQTDADLSLPFTYYGPRRTIRTVSAANLLDGQIDKEAIRGRIVVLGATATGAGDFFAVGFLHRHALGGSLKDCLCEGAACAGEVIQVIGTQLPDTTWQRLRAESAARCSTH